ncbi:hypothetical protein HPP92_016897 [Vanilla planifolia]|uniref:At2g24240-like C-terminal beta-propeller domain-containing protein n=1 Tax=Vanilla planifolia TaxID=51239 RepID=A0A835QK28_VANPL|nr:hypothetical protein HPP92_017488 [Vanilla planifolia]KAG0472351.1 hypothetical protein HPP92_016897 [Vanilla planifolia]
MTTGISVPSLLRTPAARPSISSIETLRALAYFSIFSAPGAPSASPHPGKALYQEAQFYGLLDHVRATKWGAFDGNRLRLSASVAGRAPGDGTAIRASPDGGCCVAHGGVVHVYDWLLDEHRPINLDYQQVNDVGYMDSGNIVVTARERPGRPTAAWALLLIYRRHPPPVPRLPW